MADSFLASRHKGGGQMPDPRGGGLFSQKQNFNCLMQTYLLFKKYHQYTKHIEIQWLLKLRIRANQ